MEVINTYAQLGGRGLSPPNLVIAPPPKKNI